MINAVNDCQVATGATHATRQPRGDVIAHQNKRWQTGKADWRRIRLEQHQGDCHSGTGEILHADKARSDKNKCVFQCRLNTAVLSHSRMTVGNESSPLISHCAIYRIYRIYLCVFIMFAYMFSIVSSAEWAWWDWSLVPKTISSFSALTVLVGLFFL